MTLLAVVATACGGGDDAGEEETAAEEPAEDTATDDAAAEEEPADDAEATDEADGGDEGTEAAAGGGEVADAPDFGVTSDTIRIGWMGDVTGPTAAAQGFNLAGSEAAVAYLNENGGVLGREIELVVEDDQYNPETMATNFASITGDNPVLAVVQCGNCVSLLPDFGSTGIPLISPPQTVDAQLEIPTVYNNLAHYGDEADVSVEYIANQIGSIEDAVVAVVHLEVPSGAEWNAYIQQTVEDAGGTYAGALTLNVSAPDYAGVVTQLGQLVESEGVNFVAFHGAPEGGLGMISEMVTQGLDDLPMVGIHGLAGATIYTEGPPEAAELLAAAHSFLSPLDDCEECEVIREFVAGTEWEEAAVELNFSDGWHEIMIAAEAAERAAADAGELSWDTMNAALTSAPFDTGGLTCEVDWTGGNQSLCGAVFTWNGEFMEPVQPFEEYADVIDGEYGLAG
ncbi:ABC transporter substrate-binding protein [Euzebya sp.]|uniref:ABC transporter substrate-binding protein n=1 Tax=Euzebya sp. TaxID=1971409 RepID=UPI0035170B47